MLLLFATKALIAPVLLALAAIVEHRWGAAVGGWVLGLPLTSGPASFFLLTEHGPRFAENAARGTLLGLVGAGVFVAGYSLAAQGRSWRRSLALAGIACLSVTFALSQVHLGLGDDAGVRRRGPGRRRGCRQRRRSARAKPRTATRTTHPARPRLPDARRQRGGRGRVGRLDRAGIGGRAACWRRFPRSRRSWRSRRTARPARTPRAACFAARSRACGAGRRSSPWSRCS